MASTQQILDGLIIYMRIGSINQSDIYLGYYGLVFEKKVGKNCTNITKIHLLHCY